LAAQVGRDDFNLAFGVWWAKKGRQRVTLQQLIIKIKKYILKEINYVKKNIFAENYIFFRWKIFFW
jgi:hypothetical protein